MRDQRLQINIAVTHFGRLRFPIIKPDKTIYEKENELCQFYLDLKEFPMKKAALDRAFSDLKQALTHELSLKGYLQ